MSVKVRVKLRNLADLDFDLDPNWGITPNIETQEYIRNISGIYQEYINSGTSLYFYKIFAAPLIS